MLLINCFLVELYINSLYLEQKDKWFWHGTSCFCNMSWCCGCCRYLPHHILFDCYIFITAIFSFYFGYSVDSSYQIAWYHIISHTCLLCYFIMIRTVVPKCALLLSFNCLLGEIRLKLRGYFWLFLVFIVSRLL